MTDSHETDARQPGGYEKRERKLLRIWNYLKSAAAYGTERKGEW